jgi:SAM-dependent methyltransferase
MSDEKTMSEHLNSKQRFSNRVEDYVRYRPRYPAEVIDILATEAGLQPAAIVADIGSGTGFSAELFLRNGNRVIGVEPNRQMRLAAEDLLASYANFRSVDASAEATTLADGSVDFVIAGQAFHWFDRTAALREFARILRSGGKVALMWNVRRLDSTPFLRAYDELLTRLGTDYLTARCEGMEDQTIGEFFGPSYLKRSIYNFQDFDFAGLRGRLLSSSYVPAAGEPNHAEILAGLREVFDAHAVEGRVRLEYDTQVYFGSLGG